MLVSVFFVQFAHGTAGAARIRLSLRPLIGGAAEIYLHSSGAVRGEIAKSRLVLFENCIGRWRFIRRPGERRDPYAVSLVVRDAVRRLSRNS
jgi:hypothetical protein